MCVKLPSPPSRIVYFREDIAKCNPFTLPISLRDKHENLNYIPRNSSEGFLSGSMYNVDCSVLFVLLEYTHTMQVLGGKGTSNIPMYSFLLYIDILVGRGHHNCIHCLLAG